MRLSLPFAHKLTGTAILPDGVEVSVGLDAVKQQFRRLKAQINAGWNIEHKPDGRHGAMTADTPILFNTPTATTSHYATIGIDSSINADTGAAVLAGAHVASTLDAPGRARTASFVAHGANFDGAEGWAVIQIGNVTGATGAIQRSDGSQAMAIDGATGGMTLGAPTGGENGLGTLNAAGDVYKNNSAYTNPDYVFEHAFTGQIEHFKDRPGAAQYRGRLPLSELEAYVRTHHRFPQIQDRPTGIFERGDLALELIEQQMLYIFELASRVRELETAHHA